MKELAEMADVLTPNLTEACILTDRPYKKEGWTRERDRRTCERTSCYGTLWCCDHRY